MISTIDKIKSKCQNKNIIIFIQFSLKQTKTVVSLEIDDDGGGCKADDERSILFSIIPGSIKQTNHIYVL